MLTTTNKEGRKPVKRSARGSLPAALAFMRRPLLQLIRIDLGLTEQGAKELGRVLIKLGPAFLGPTERRTLGVGDYPGQDGNVRDRIDGLTDCEWIAQALGRSAAQVGEDLERQQLLFSIQLGSAQLKSQGMDTHLVQVAFSAWILRRVLGWLRGKLADPAATDDYKKQLLSDFRPILSLLKEDQVLQEGDQARQADKHDELLGQVEAADAQVRELKAKMDARQGRTPDLGTLRDLQNARSGQSKPDPTLHKTPGGKTKKGTRKGTKKTARGTRR